MDVQHRLLLRLEQVGKSVAATGNALALISLGSAGLERDRIDAYSDLDFFVIARDECKQWFLDDLSWLSAICPIAYHFQNTDDGFKLLYEDGIFCEFGIFRRAELETIPFTPGRIVWKADGVDDQIAMSSGSTSSAAPRSVEWIVGEALTNLYIGLGRYRRGEKLTAQRCIQHYAVDRVLELMERIEPPQTSSVDPFARERRYERRFPNTAAALPRFIQGYDRSPQSALAILEFLESQVAVNPAIAQAIRSLA